ncbi:MAG: hypothetical protein ACP5TL_01650 [Candidatus Micrarchaeia archaeon]
MNRSKVLFAFSLTSALFGIVSAIYGAIAISALLISACLAFAYFFKKGYNNFNMYDLLIFTNNLVVNASNEKSTLKAIENSLDRRFAFYDDVSKAIREYRLSGNADKAFSFALKNPSELFREVFFVISDSLSNGLSIVEPMKELSAEIAAIEELQSKNVGNFTNTMSIVNLGSILFFPIFAGISYYIMGFSSNINRMVPISEAAFFSMVILYVMEIGIFNNIHGNVNRLSLIKVLSSIAVSALLFKASYLVALNGIRW